MLTLWGNADSVNVQKITWACDELAVPVHRIDAGRHFGVVDTPAFRALNPNGLVPTIDDDGVVVWESGAILRYLCARHGAGTLWPVDVAARADADRWIDWSGSTLWPALVPLFRAFHRTPAGQRDAGAIAAWTREALAAMRILDAHLGRHAHVGGEAFTMGDIAVGCAAWRWFALPLPRDAVDAGDARLPHATRWMHALQARPAFDRHVWLLPS